MSEFEFPLKLSASGTEQWVYGSNESGTTKVLAEWPEEVLWVVTHCRNDDGSTALTFINEKGNEGAAQEKQSVTLKGRKISVRGGKQSGTNHGCLVRIGIA